MARQHSTNGYLSNRCASCLNTRAAVFVSFEVKSVNVCDLLASRILLLLRFIYLQFFFKFLLKTAVALLHTPVLPLWLLLIPQLL